MHVVEPTSQASPIAIEGPTADPGMARPPVPGDDPIVEREPERRQVLVGRRERGQALEDRADVVAQEADEPAEEWRRIRGDDDRPIEAGHEAARDCERVRPGGRRLEDGDRVCRQVGPARVAARSCALEQDEARQVAEGLGGIDRARAGDAVRQTSEPDGSL